jgi:hypothetical protein
MITKTFASLAIAFGIATGLAGSALAAGDAGAKPPSPPPVSLTVEKDTPRCLPAAVTSCRAACDKDKPVVPLSKVEAARKSLDCKQSCVQGC